MNFDVAQPFKSLQPAILIKQKGMAKLAQR